MGLARGNGGYLKSMGRHLANREVYKCLKDFIVEKSHKLGGVVGGELPIIRLYGGSSGARHCGFPGGNPLISKGGS